MAKELLVFPKGFLWGSAISAHQTEGNNINSDWWVWENSPKRQEELKTQNKNPQEYLSGVACDFFNRYESDFDILEQLNQNAFRLSLEWAKLEPTRGVFDEHITQRYEKILASLKRRNIKTFITLHHFTCPLWFSANGGFTKKSNVQDFVDYVGYCVRKFDKYADFWISINEPEIFASHAYLYGKWPPQMKSPLTTYRVVKNIILAHRQAFALIKKMSGKPVSMSYHITDLQPDGIMGTPATNVLDYILNRYILNRTADSCDFIGLNYYNHAHVSVLGRRMESRSEHKVSDMGWGIHPEGIERVLMSLKKFNKPIYITENGIADSKDSQRADFIRDHLIFTHRSIVRGIDVRGYLYWSLLDNFEWHHGFWPRFGLVEVDYATQKRNIRPSARVYAQICKTNTLTP